MKRFILIILSVIAIPVHSQTTIGDTRGTDGVSPKKIIEPEKSVAKASFAAIDDESFELGLRMGSIAIDNFSASSHFGGSFIYHISPNWLARVDVLEATVPKTPREKEVGSSISGDRKYAATNFLIGTKVFRGRSFKGERNKFNSDIYFLAGLTSVDFNDNTTKGPAFGTSYRTILTDSFLVSLDFLGYSVDQKEVAGGETQSSLNTEISLGFNWFF